MAKRYGKSTSQTDPSSPEYKRTPTGIGNPKGKAGPGQLKMLMTPREIMSEFAPLEGDREGTYGETAGTDDSRAGSRTDRSHRTDGQSNVRLRPIERSGTDSNLGRAYVRPSESHMIERSAPETDEQLWSRKYDEATERGVHGEHYGASGGGTDTSEHAPFLNKEGESTWDNKGSWHNVSGGSVGNTRKPIGFGGIYRRTDGGVSDNSRYREQRERSNEPNPLAGQPKNPKPAGMPNTDHGDLATSIIHEGVMSPVRLQAAQFGKRVPTASGKPEVLGGHHRLAVAMVHRPDDPIPVIHEASLYAAKSNPVWKYT